MEHWRYYCLAIVKKISDITESIVDKKYNLIWCTYDLLEKNRFPYADVVILHFDRTMARESTFESIVKVKGKLGHMTPILTLIEGGTPQEIYSMLKVGAYDYLESADDPDKYKKKIEELILWDWYIKKRGRKKKSSDI